MLEFINAFCIFLPIVIIVYYFLDYKICRCFDKRVDLDHYFKHFTSIKWVLVVFSAIDFIILLVINIIFFTTAYNYKITRHYCSYTFIITAMSILLIGYIYIISKLDMKRIYYAIKRFKLQKKIGLIEERIRDVSNISGVDSSMREKTLKVLEEYKDRYDKEILYLSTFCIVDKKDRKALRSEYFKK